MENFFEKYYGKIISYFSGKSLSALINISVFSTLALGITDYLTGYEFSFSIFYLPPVIFSTWFVSRKNGLFISVLSAATWGIADITSGHVYIHPIFILWNTLMRLGFFLVAVFAFNELKKSLQREKTFARMDYITGVPNARYFYEMAHSEIERAERYHHAISVAYLDIDNFKQINDNFGHSVGDKLLEEVASVSKKNIRITDMVARLGGDEFAVYFTETDGVQAKNAIDKIRGLLDKTMEHHIWPVTFSIGVVTCHTPGCSVDNLIRAADTLMYDVKNSGKNMAKYEIIKT